MPRTLDDIMATLPEDRRQRIETRAQELATLKDLRLALQKTQEELAATLGVRRRLHVALTCAEWRPAAVLSERAARDVKEQPEEES